MQVKVEEPSMSENPENTAYESSLSGYSDIMHIYMSYESSQLISLQFSHIASAGQKPISIEVEPGEPNSISRLLYLFVFFITQVGEDLQNAESKSFLDPHSFIRDYKNKIHLIHLILKQLSQASASNYAQLHKLYRVLFSDSSKFITVLMRSNYLEEAIAVEKHLNKIIDHILTEISKKKTSKSIHRLTREFTKFSIQYQTEIAYCLVQKGEINAALVYGTEALEAMATLDNESNDLCGYKILHHGLLSLYHLEVDFELAKAKANLDRVIQLKSKSESVACPDLLAHCCNLLSTKLFLEGRYAEALAYTRHEIICLQEELVMKAFQNKTILQETVLIKIAKQGTNDRMLPLWIKNVEDLLNQAEKKITHLQLKIFKTKKEKLIPFLNTIPLKADKPYEFNAQTKELIVFVDNQHLRFAKKIFTVKGNPPEIRLELLGLNLSDFCKKGIRFQKLVEQQNSAVNNTISQKQENTKSPTLFTGSYSLIAEQFEQQPARKNKRPKKLKNSVDVSETENESKKRKEPESIRWEKTNQIYDPQSDQSAVYALSRKPQIPEGRWYAYLDVATIAAECEKAKQNEDSVLKSIIDVLKRGLISNNTQGVSFAIKELKGTGYVCKMRILGEHGKGDIRVYGRVVDTTKDENSKRVRQLIYFDSIAFHAHKKTNLPILEKQREVPLHLQDGHLRPK